MKLNSGVTMIEQVISIAILAMMSITLVSAYGTLVAAKTKARILQEAVQYGREYVEILAYISNHSLSVEKIFLHVKGKNGVCSNVRIMMKADKSYFHADEGKGGGNNPMLLNGGEEGRGIYARTTELCPVYRHKTTGKLFEGVPLPSKKHLYDEDEYLAKATVKVRTIEGNLMQPVEITTYLVKASML